MKIYFGADHAGLALKRSLAARLEQAGHQVVDVGTHADAPTDYPDWAARVARAVREQPGARGIVACGSGVGVCIVANKIQGVRAVDAFSLEVARLSRAHNDSNVLCLGARLVSEADAAQIALAWLETPFEAGRHEQRLGKIAAVEFGEGAQAAVRREMDLLARRRAPRRIWARDPGVFVADADTNEPARRSILNRLGWLDAPEGFAAHIAELERFAADVHARGFRQAVLMGMGGSSLCPEVLARTFAPGGAGQNGIELIVLDSTDPAAVADVERRIDLARTLFIVASKSGGTIEVASFESYFWSKALAAGGLARARDQFCAITDGHTELHHRARDRYHKTFVNPADIGGRYSALSLFGLVPAALLGIPLGALLGEAQTTAAACRREDVRDNPSAALGAFLGGLAKQGRDKLTLLASPEIASLGAWIEQLIAESPGKLGRGVVPVDLEPVGPPAAYGDDRAFVVLRLSGSESKAPLPADEIEALRMAGHPVLELELPTTLALGAEFFRWEFATAVAGASLGINPFDEPNVTEAKEATSRALKVYWQKGALPDPGPVLAPDDAVGLLGHLSTAGPGDYIALMAFFQQTPARDALLADIRRACRDRWQVATTVGYGPRFLHSTGQLHKGGPPQGVFLQLWAPAATDLDVPERGFSFGLLRDAQALGDLEALRQHKRRVARVGLPVEVEAGLRKLLAALTAPAG